VQIRPGIDRPQGSRYRHSGTVIASHGINCNGDPGQGTLPLFFVVAVVFCHR